MLRIFFLLTLGLLCFNTILADQVRLRYSFKSKNLRFELKPCDTIFSDPQIYRDSLYDSLSNSYYRWSYSFPDRYYWGLYDTQTKEKLYTIKNDSLHIEFKTAIISDDGQNIVIIDDYSAGFAYNGFEVMTFYVKDSLVKDYMLGELIGNLCSLTYSVSHMMWCSSFSWHNNQNEITIKTNELYVYTFNKNGELISKRSNEFIQPNDELLVGVIKRIAKNKYVIKVKLCIRGKLMTDEIIEIDCKDKEMKKIYGKHYGFLKSKNLAMNNEFTETIIIRNSKVEKIDFNIPIYNSRMDCLILNSLK